jgi:hypothetical protein
VFDQYLRTTQIPKLEYYFSNDRDKVFYRWANCVKSFNLPIVLKNNQGSIRIVPGDEWKSVAVKENQLALFDKASIEKMYYITPVVAENRDKTASVN